jgi:hypothetical protein
MARPELIEHAKFRKLMRLLGERTPIVLGYLELLWIRARKRRTPVLGTALDVESDAEYLGQDGKFANAAFEAGLLDKTEDGQYVVHDLEDHTPKFPKLIKAKVKVVPRPEPPVEPDPVPEEKPVEAVVEMAKARPRNGLFDAVAEVSGCDPKGNGGLIAAAVKKLGSFEKPVTPEEVREFGRRFWELCPWAQRDGRDRPTPMEICNHIGRLRAKPADVKPVSRSQFAESHASRLLDALKPRGTDG